MNALAVALDRGLDVKLAEMAAHEVGHGVAFRAAGLTVERMRVARGWFGGLDCYTELAGVPTELMEGYLVGLMAGEAASERFLLRYTDVAPGAARRAAQVGGTFDRRFFHRDARRVRRGRLSVDAARSRAVSLVAADGARIDRLTLRLARTGRLRGGAL